MGFRMTQVVGWLLCVAVCFGISQELQTGKSLANNSLILSNATRRIASEVRKMVVRKDVHEELKLTSDQQERLAAMVAKQKSLIAMQQEIGLDGELKTIGDMSEKKMREVTAQISKVVDKDREVLISGIDDTLTESQVSRLTQILVQHELLHRNRRALPRFGMPLPRKISDDDRQQLQTAIRLADREIMRSEMIKLRYVYYGRALNTVLGKGSAEEFMGEPFGFEVESHVHRETVKNPRRSR